MRIYNMAENSRKKMSGELVVTGSAAGGIYIKNLEDLKLRSGDPFFFYREFFEEHQGKKMRVRGKVNGNKLNLVYEVVD
jgi:orotate phosphoribosyltransferase